MLMLGTLIPLLELTSAIERSLTDPALDLTQNCVDDLEFLFVGQGEELLDNVTHTMGKVEDYMEVQGLKLSARKCIVMASTRRLLRDLMP
eukprot:4059078-Amphidinium_carterae.1